MDAGEPYQYSNMDSATEDADAGGRDADASYALQLEKDYVRATIIIALYHDLIHRSPLSAPTSRAVASH
jgi:hypothetical protein